MAYWLKKFPPSGIQEEVQVSVPSWVCWGLSMQTNHFMLWSCSESTSPPLHRTMYERDHGFCTSGLHRFWQAVIYGCTYRACLFQLSNTYFKHELWAHGHNSLQWPKKAWLDFCKLNTLHKNHCRSHWQRLLLCVTQLDPWCESCD